MDILKNRFFILVAIVAIVAIFFTSFSSGGSETEEISVTKLIEYAQASSKDPIKINRIEVSLTDGG